MMPRILEPVATELVELEPLLVSFLTTRHGPTNQIVEHIFSSGGKRIRPSLFLLVSKLIGYKGEHLFPIAAVCEYIHTASLLHDDVIDNSTLRRGKPTTNSIWGDETAVLAGDLIYSTACRIMVKTRSLELIDSFAECIRIMSESELFQLELLWNINTTRNDLSQVIEGKTASLFAASASTVGYLANISHSSIQAFSDFGFELGFAFQIADDCLDYESSAKDLGKSILADLTEGKITLPLLCALQNFQGNELRCLVERILQSGTASSDDLQLLNSYVAQSGGIQDAKAIAVQHSQKALERLNFAVSDLASYDKSALESLSMLTSFVLERKN